MFKLSHKFSWIRKVARGRSRGFTLTEVVIAIVVLALVVASIPATMIVVHKMQARQDERRFAEYLTRSQLEYIKSQPYNWGNVTGECPRGCCEIYFPICYEKAPFTENYYLDFVAIPVNSITHEPLFDVESYSGGPVEDQGIQEITVYVYSSSKTEPVLVTTNYKVALGEE